MRVCHLKSARFDDPTLVSTAGLVPVMALAQRAGLGALADQLLSVPGPAGAHASAKVGAVVAGPTHARATTATIRGRLIHVAARVVTTARRLHLHLPATWPWASGFTAPFEATCGPPPLDST